MSGKNTLEDALTLPNAVACKNGQVVFGVAPRFLSPKIAGKRLGHSHGWLDIQSKKHDLFKPTVRGRGKGCPCFYDVNHLELIADYMINEPDFTSNTKLMDEALMIWRRECRNRLQRHFDKAK